jgi:hypothetical protein
MAEELKVKIVGEIPEGAEHSSVRARFTADAAEDVKGQGRGWSLAPTEDDAEGQTRTWGFTPVEAEDAEGQGIARGGFKPVEGEDAEGQGIGRGGFKPVEGEDAEGQARRYLKPVEGEDAEGNVLKSHVLEIERGENGELVGRYVLAGDDDTEGQGGHWP